MYTVCIEYSVPVNFTTTKNATFKRRLGIKTILFHQSCSYPFTEKCLKVLTFLRSLIVAVFPLNSTAFAFYFVNRRLHCASGCDAACRTKWKRQTTAPMRAEQLRNHSCEEKDCPGARRLHQNATSTPTGSEVMSSFCRHCDVMQGLNGTSTVQRRLNGTSTVASGASDDSLGSELQQQSTTSITGQLLSRLYLGTLPLPFSNYCRL